MIVHVHSYPISIEFFKCAVKHSALKKLKSMTEIKFLVSRNKHYYPVLLGSTAEKSPVTPVPCTIEGVILSSLPGNLSFFCADWALVGVVPFDLGVVGWFAEGGVLCWNNSFRNSRNETRPSPSASNLSNNCCSCYRNKLHKYNT